MNLDQWLKIWWEGETDDSCSISHYPISIETYLADSASNRKYPSVDSWRTGSVHRHFGIAQKSA